MTKAEREAYTKRVDAEIAKLKARLASEHAHLSAVQAERVWKYAWDQGYPCGLTEIEFIYNEVAGLFQP